MTDTGIIVRNLKALSKRAWAGSLIGFPPGRALAPLRAVYRAAGMAATHAYTDAVHTAAVLLLIAGTAAGLRSVWAPDGGELPEAAIERLAKRLSPAHGIDEGTVRKLCDSLAERDSAAAERDVRLLSEQAEPRRQSAPCDALSELERAMTALSGPADIEPQAWDAESWREAWLPIRDSRDRYRQHSFRADYYRQHLALVERRCYISENGNRVDIPWDPYEAAARSRMYRTELHPEPCTLGRDTVIEVYRGDCLDAAKELAASETGRVAVLNLANRQNPGGGVYTGSGAQEESCFLRSDYHTTLYSLADYAEAYGLPRGADLYPMDRNFGGVWSSDVTIFRGRELRGYPLLDEPWRMNFIAVAALNRPPVYTDENGELRLTPPMVTATLNKLRTIFGIAIDNDVDSLVLGAIGCGAFRNPPKHVAELFRQVLEEPPYRGRFTRVVFAILSPELCDIFAKVFGVEVR